MNKFVSFLCLATLLSSLEMSGQQTRGSVSGTVKDEAGFPLSGASVVIDSLSTGVAADNDGNYTIRGLRNGRYTVRFSYTGYEPVIVSADVEGPATVDAVLREATIITGEVVVRSSRAGSRTPMSHLTVGSEELRKSDMTKDMPYLLALTPSVVETSDAGNGVGYTSLRIRGSDASRINITLDGIPLNDAESQQVFWVDLPDLASSTGSIQIQRGAGTSTNGAGAFGATINISSSLLPDDPGAEIDLTAGSFSTFRTSAKAWSGLIDDRFNMLIRASGISSDGYIEHSSTDMRSLMATATWATTHDRIRVNYLYGDERTGISWWGVPQEMLKTNRRYNPAGEYTDANGVIRYYDDETDNYMQSHYHLFYTHVFNRDLVLNTALHMTDGSGYYEEQKSDRDPEEYGIGPIFSGGELITETDLVQRKWMSNLFYGAVWSVMHQGHGLELAFGGSANRYDGDHYGNIIWLEYPGSVAPGYEWYRNNGLKDEASLYAKATITITSTLTGFADLQYRYIGYRFTGYDDDLRDLTQNHYYSFFNPKAGLYWSNGKGSNAWLSASVAHREPTRTNFTDAAGDEESTPGPERLTDYESGYSFSNASLNLSLNLYLMQYRDQLVPTGRISNTGYPVMTNVSESYRAGVEMSGGYRPSRFFGMKMNLTYSRNRIRDFRNYFFNYNTTDWSEEYVYDDLGDVNIAYSPALTGSAVLETNPFGGLEVYLAGKYVGKQYFDNTMSNERLIDPYFVCNLSLQYRITPRLPQGIILKLQVSNLLNTKYENNAYGGMWTEDGAEKTWAYFFPQAGIHYIFGMTVTF